MYKFSSLNRKLHPKGKEHHLIRRNKSSERKIRNKYIPRSVASSTHNMGEMTQKPKCRFETTVNIETNVNELRIYCTRIG